MEETSQEEEDGMRPHFTIREYGNYANHPEN